MSDHLDHNRLQTDNLAESRNAVATPPTLSDRVKSLRLANPQASQGSRLGWLPWVLCGIFFLVAAGMTFIAYGMPKFGAPPPAAPVSDLKAGSGDVVLEQKGYIIPSRTYQISPKVGGMVQKLNIQKEGDIFKEGAVLAELENDDYKADVAHARSTLANARARLAQLKKELPEEIKKAEYELEQSKSQLRQYVLDLERAQDLFHRQSISKSELDSARAIKEAKESEVNKLTHAYRLVSGSADERVRAFEAEVAQDDADVSKAEWRLKNTIILAPVIDPKRTDEEKSRFTVLTKKAEEGNLVNPIAFNISANICEMADLAKLEVDITIQERDIKHVNEGQPCRIQAEGFPDRKPYPGEVLRIMPNADRAKGAIPVRVKLLSLHPGEKPGEFLRPDTGVIVSFLKTDAKETDKKDDKKSDGK